MSQFFPATNKLTFTLTATCLAVLFLQFDINAQAGSKTYVHRAADGTVTFSDFPLRDGAFVRHSYSNATRPASVVNPCRGLTRKALAEKGRRLDKEFLAAARAFGIDAALIKAVARAESCFDPSAVSGAGAKGLMQLMPATASELGVSDIFNRTQNLRGGADYLARMLQRYDNDTDLALAAYNAGPGNVEKYNGIPPFPETINYIKSVRTFQQQYSALSTAN
ncbi:MAG: lytic transglycosylase domain-containing protein [Granulosicoccus sp.]